MNDSPKIELHLKFDENFNFRNNRCMHELKSTVRFKQIGKSNDKSFLVTINSGRVKLLFDKLIFNSKMRHYFICKLEQRFCVFICCFKIIQT